MPTPLEAIWEKCLDCCCGQHKEVQQCTSKKCPLHSFRVDLLLKEEAHVNESNK